MSADNDSQTALSAQGVVTATSHFRVVRADNGSEISLSELMETRGIPLLWSIDDRNRLVHRKATGHVEKTSREMLRLELASGRRLELASDQQLLKLEGWAPVAELVKGSRIGVLRRLGTPVDPQPMDDSEVILLAHMIGDGSCVRRQPIRYASVDEANLAAGTAAAAHFGVTQRETNSVGHVRPTEFLLRSGQELVTAHSRSPTRTQGAGRNVQLP